MGEQKPKAGNRTQFEPQHLAMVAGLPVQELTVPGVQGLLGGFEGAGAQQSRAKCLRSRGATQWGEAQVAAAPPQAHKLFGTLSHTRGISKDSVQCQGPLNSCFQEGFVGPAFLLLQAAEEGGPSLLLAEAPRRPSCWMLLPSSLVRPLAPTLNDPKPHNGMLRPHAGCR